MQSGNNLKQLGLALHSYNDVYNKMPSNGSYQNLALAGKEGPASWCYKVLPFVEQTNMYNNYQWNIPLKVFIEPGRGGTSVAADGITGCWYWETAGNPYPVQNPNQKGIGATTDYAANWLVIKDVVWEPAPLRPDGGWSPNNKSFSIQGISDGSSNTFLAGGKALLKAQVTNRFGGNWDETVGTGGSGGTCRGPGVWMDGGLNGAGLPNNVTWYNRVTRPVQDAVGDPNTSDIDRIAAAWGGPYAGGALFLMGDGGVRTLTYSVDQATVAGLTSPAGGEVVSATPQ